MEEHRNYKLQRTIIPVTSPFRIWKYEIENITTGGKFVHEIRIEDCLEYNLMPPEDLQTTVERQIKWYLNQENEADRIVEFKSDPQNKSVQFVEDKAPK